jgi:hypothetical protein
METLPRASTDVCGERVVGEPRFHRLPIRRSEAEEMLSRPEFADRYRKLYREAEWLQSGPSRTLAEAVAGVLARASAADAEARLRGEAPSPPSADALLAEAEANAGVEVPDFVRTTVLRGMPAPPTLALLPGFPPLGAGQAKVMVRNALSRNELVAYERRSDPIFARAAKNMPTTVLYDRAANRLRSAYEKSQQTFRERFGPAPWSARVVRDHYPEVFRERSGTSGSAALRDRVVQWLLWQTGVQRDDRLQGHEVLAAISGAVAGEANALARELAAVKRRELLERQAAAANGPIAEPNVPLPRRTEDGERSIDGEPIDEGALPRSEASADEAPLASVAEPGEERRERAREEARPARGQRHRGQGPSRHRWPDRLSAQAVPAQKAEPPARRDNGLRALIHRFAIDEAAERQILRALPELGDDERGVLRRILHRIAEGVRTFDLGPNVRYATGFGIWEIRPQKGSNHRLCLQFANGRAYLINLLDVKASAGRQDRAFREAQKRWKTFLNTGQ